MDAERLKSVKREVQAMRNMLRNIESELERLIGEMVRGSVNVMDDQTVYRASVEVIGELNRVTGRSFDPTATNTVYLVRNLLNEGRTPEDMKRVVRKMALTWDNSQMRLFLRPETLFGEHFESYLQLANTELKNGMDLQELADMAIKRQQEVTRCETGH